MEKISEITKVSAVSYQMFTMKQLILYYTYPTQKYWTAVRIFLGLAEILYYKIMSVITINDNYLWMIWSNVSRI